MVQGLPLASYVAFKGLYSPSFSQVLRCQRQAKVGSDLAGWDPCP